MNIQIEYQIETAECPEILYIKIRSNVAQMHIIKLNFIVTIITILNVIQN